MLILTSSNRHLHFFKFSFRAAIGLKFDQLLTLFCPTQKPQRCTSVARRPARGAVMISNDEDIRLSFLLSGSCDLPPSYIKLRSYLNIHLSNVADQLNLKLLKSFRNRNKTCPHCYSPWSGDTTSFKLLPAKKFAQHKVDDTVHEVRNTLVLKCRVCTKKSKFSLVKKKIVKEKINKEDVIVKKDKSRVVNSQKMEYQSPGMLTKKKKRTGDSGEKNKAQTEQLGQKSPQTPKGRLNSSDHNKKFLPNPFAIQKHNQHSKRKDKKLERLKQAMKQDQGSAKKTLLDFLSLVK